jgi:hypothetical protein
MIAQYVGFTVTLTNRIRLIERRTRAYGRLKPEPIKFGRCRINKQVRAHAIHELFGLIVAKMSSLLNSVPTLLALPPDRSVSVCAKFQINKPAPQFELRNDSGLRMTLYSFLTNQPEGL